MSTAPTADHPPPPATTDVGSRPEVRAAGLAGAWPRRLQAPPAYRRLRRRYRAGRFDEVLREGPTIAAQLATDPAARGWHPAAVLTVGTALAARDVLGPARRALTTGLAELPGTASAADVGRGDLHELLLLEILLHQGAFADAAARVPPLGDPDRPLETRLAALRVNAGLHLRAGGAEQAYELLNAASDLAAQRGRRLLHALVDSDRAVLLAEQDRHVDASRALDEVLEALCATTWGPIGAQALQQGALSASAVAACAARADDLMTADRFLQAGWRAARSRPRPRVEAHLQLAVATVARSHGRPDLAADAAHRAARLFRSTGGEPGVAAARRAQALAAADRGWRASATPLLEQALRVQRRLGLPLEAQRTRAALTSLDTP